MLPGWNRITIAGKPVDVFDPPHALPFALLYLHDELGATPATNPILTAKLHAHHLRCIAPITGRSWWVDRIAPAFDPALTPERHLLDNVAQWIESAWKLAPRAVAVAGVGMGGQGAVRLGLRHPARFPIVASLEGAFDFHEQYGRGTPLDDLYDSREQARQDTAVLHVHGHDWPPHIWFACSPSSDRLRGNDRLHEKLAAIGVPHTAELDGADVGTMLAFILSALARESRRLA
jgi:pimeloyl-ACP methyl ester carboxylesterase